MSIALIGTIVGILVGLIAIGTFVFKVFRKLNVLTEGIMGNAAVTDNSGAEIKPAMPSLQAQMSQLKTQVTDGNSDTSKRLDRLEEWRDRQDAWTIEHQQDSDSMYKQLAEIGIERIKKDLS